MTNEPLDALWLTILTRFYRLLDSGDIEGLSALMTREFLWRRQGVELRSEADVRTALSQRRADAHFFHILSSVIFEHTNTSTARYTGYLLLLRAHADPSVAVRMAPSGVQSLHLCEGQLSLDGEGWKISTMDAGPPRILVDIKEAIQ